jgi:hypothetical protein
LLVAGCAQHGSYGGGSTASSTGTPSTTLAAPESPSTPIAGGLQCADIGGAFVAHGTDGRGDCMSANPSPACHIKPADQPADGNYVAEITMKPPFPGGVIDPEVARIMIQGADNPQCWRLPPG